MLVRITDKCTQGCSHCLVDSVPSGKHMTFSEFYNAIRFAISCGDESLLISGGEPTDNPSFHDFLNYAMMNFQGKIFVLSHGGFLQTRADVDNLVGRYPSVTFQFTSDPLYYKDLIPSDVADYIDSHRNAYVTRSLQDTGGFIYPQGRAIRLGVTPETTRSIASKCFNLRSFVNAGYSLKSAIGELRARAKMCTPSVNTDGSISMGESNQCPSVGNTTDNLDALTSSVKNSQCDDCGMICNLHPQYKSAIGFKS
ncbi:radical SAM protein [Vibrio crassostreae]|uniref:radical SAM protein n=1 Tax=Vibrio crassostreae TaxID=246167 RepID=UPI001B3144F8|nr:radical SAM protein [Vibrio crassostreae]